MKLSKIFLILFLTLPLSDAVRSSDSCGSELSISSEELQFPVQALADDYLAPQPFYYLRHGLTDWNKKKLYMGATDVPINDDGLVQAENAAKVIEGYGFHIGCIVTGPLRRAVETANVIGRRLKKDVIVMDEFKQCCWGSVEGRPLDNGAMIQRWLDGETPDGAETRMEFDSRIRRGLRAVFRLPGPALIISHGGVYRAILRIFNLPNQNIDHCVPYFHCPAIPNGLPWIIGELKKPHDDGECLSQTKKHRFGQDLSPQDEETEELL